MAGVPRTPSSMGDWIRYGACGDEDPEIFWPTTGPGNADRAREICNRCTVVSQCRAWALANNPDGFWGGMSDSERRKAKRTNKRTNQVTTTSSGDPSADAADRVLVGCGIGS